MDLKNVLRDLCCAAGVNGCTQAAETVKAFLSAYTTDIHCDAMGNVWGVFPCKDNTAPTILLEAHLDEVGFVVTQVEDGGFLRVSACGGPDNRALSSARVSVLTQPPCSGVFCSVPPHLSADNENLPEIDHRYIDIGTPHTATVGTRVVFEPHFEELLGDRVSAKALDNRAGVAAVLRAVDLLDTTDLPVRLVVAFSTAEELGMRGCKTAAFTIKPNAAVVVDVSFAHTPDSKKSCCGTLGGGVMLGISPILDGAMTNALRSLATDQQIPVQSEVMGGTTGTNADVVTITAEGIPTALLSVPLRYMHTPIETVALSDIEATAQLMAAFVRKGEVPCHA